MIEPFEAYQIYHGLYLHFTSDYDYLLYNGKTKYTQEKFNKRKDKYTFHKIARLFLEKNELECYIAWLFLTNETVYPRSICSFTKEYQRDCVDWHKDGIKHHNNNLKKIVSEDLLKNVDDLFKLVLENEISIFTYIRLDGLYKCSKKINERLKGDYLWDKAYIKLTKYWPLYFTWYINKEQKSNEN